MIVLRSIHGRAFPSSCLDYLEITHTGKAGEKVKGNVQVTSFSAFGKAIRSCEKR